MKVTRQFLLDNATIRGSWTRAQLNVLGIGWPPAKGWQERIEGYELSDREVDQFKRYRFKKGSGDIHAIYSELILRLDELPEAALVILHSKIIKIIGCER
jgi:hypothetical protein